MSAPSTSTSSGAARGTQPIVIPNSTVEDEDAIIHARITNDERPLRRVLKKFHNYTSVSHVPIVPHTATLGTDGGRPTVDDAREAFLVELESFHLSLKKSVMICEAEARQVEEYQKEKQRIEDEHGKLVGQIEQLKTALEHAQMIRRRKIEYDLVAERINTLPNREELDRSIQGLENDMEAIRTEHDTQNRTIHGQKSALDGIVTELENLRFLGKDKENVSHLASPLMTPAAEGNTYFSEGNPEGGLAESLGTSNNVSAMGDGPGEIGEVEERTEKATLENVPHSSLDPTTKPFYPGSKREEDDDIEMGEVAEGPKNTKGKKKAREELEEGEASDSSSALSDPPDD